MDDDGLGTLALIGPGRAGSTIALALQTIGWDVAGVAGRAPDAASTVACAVCLGTETRLVSELGAGASLVIVATPDDAIRGAASTVAPSLEAGALIVHLAGSRGLDVFDDLLARRPDVRVGALHPLQTFPTVSDGLDRLAGAWAAVAGDDAVNGIAASLGLHAVTIDDDARVGYHAAAVIASNHVVALMGQVERLARRAGVPFEAFRALVDASVDNAFELGPETALTGPVARGDLSTVERHLADLDPTERDAYRSLAREAARLAARRDTALDRLLGDLRAME